MIKHSIISGVFAAAVLLLGPPEAGAQAPNGFVVDRFSGSGAQVYDIVNYCNLPGTPLCSEFDAAAYTCANIYVYHNEDIVACGSCFVSPNGSLQERLHADILAAPVTGVQPANGVVKFVTTQFTENFCDPSALGKTAASNLNTDLIGSPVTGVKPTSGVVKWVTTPFEPSFFCDPTNIGATANSAAYFRDRNGLDIELEGVPLSVAEKDRLNRDCSAIVDVLSGLTNAFCSSSDPAPKSVKHATTRKHI